jgi:hypothetical protein
MIRRMEARISSIEGSTAFADCVIPTPRAHHADMSTPARPQRFVRQKLFVGRHKKYGMTKIKRKQLSVDTSLLADQRRGVQE